MGIKLQALSFWKGIVITVLLNLVMINSYFKINNTSRRPEHNGAVFTVKSKFFVVNVLLKHYIQVTFPLISSHGVVCPSRDIMYS